VSANPTARPFDSGQPSILPSDDCHAGLDPASRPDVDILDCGSGPQ
jgi:hypothetical protein